MNLETNSIETKMVPNCMLCNHIGDLLYADMKDHLFGASGNWTLKKCSNDQCGLVWLDPMPTEADIIKAYRSYYTHGVEVVPAARWKAGIIKICIRLMNLLAFPLTISLRHVRYNASMAYLTGVARGSLLEVGCGDGSYLNRMRSLGWSVEGVDVDECVPRRVKDVFSYVAETCGRLQTDEENADALLTLLHAAILAYPRCSAFQEAARGASVGMLVALMQICDGGDGCGNGDDSGTRNSDGASRSITRSLG